MGTVKIEISLQSAHLCSLINLISEEALDPLLHIDHPSKTLRRVCGYTDWSEG